MIDRNMFCKLKVAVDFLRIVFCLILSRALKLVTQTNISREGRTLETVVLLSNYCDNYMGDK